MHLEC